MDFSAILELFSTSRAWISLGMLTLMEIVLGIDNIIFISIVANKLPEDQQPKARNIGLTLAMLLRIVLLFGITLIISMREPLFSFNFFGQEAGFTGQSLILILGGLFLLYKASTEIHHKLEGQNAPNEGERSAKNRLSGVIFQITMLNIVFSFDSILTAVGLTQDIARTPMVSDPTQFYDPLPIMILGVVLSMIIMMVFAGPIGRFVNKHPSIQVLGLSFLVLIGFMLVVEGAHSAHMMPENVHIPKGYMYFAIFFSLTVELINIKVRQRGGNPVQLRGALEEAKERDIYDMNADKHPPVI